MATMNLRPIEDLAKAQREQEEALMVRERARGARATAYSGRRGIQVEKGFDLG